MQWTTNETWEQPKVTMSYHPSKEHIYTNKWSVSKQNHLNKTHTPLKTNHKYIYIQYMYIYIYMIIHIYIYIPWKLMVKRWFISFLKNVLPFFWGRGETRNLHEKTLPATPRAVECCQDTMSRLWRLSDAQWTCWLVGWWYKVSPLAVTNGTNGLTKTPVGFYEDL